MNSVLIIAEAGVNHNGSIKTALKLVDAASAAGADVIKFQTFKTESIVTRNAQKAAYQNNNDGRTNTQYDMLKQLEFTKDDFREIYAYCRKKNIGFSSTAFDFESITLLHDNFSMPFWKIPSGEITNLPYLRKIAELGKEIILSTGMATLDEIRDALDVLSTSGISKDDITVLHCTTEYPADRTSVNLRAMQTISDTFAVKVGYSDHTEGIEIPIAATALGATVIEKHFTLDKTMEGPDHKASLDPTELNAMITAIRNVTAALGDGKKAPLPIELENRKVARKSIVAKRAIARGERFTEENLTVKRPGTGMSPMKWDALIGTVAPKSFSVDEMVVL
jgi:N,N'-diacetyllegionaminate synthase